MYEAQDLAFAKSWWVRSAYGLGKSKASLLRRCAGLVGNRWYDWLVYIVYIIHRGYRHNTINLYIPRYLSQGKEVTTSSFKGYPRWSNRSCCVHDVSGLSSIFLDAGQLLTSHVRNEMWSSLMGLWKISPSFFSRTGGLNVLPTMENRVGNKIFYHNTFDDRWLQSKPRTP